MEQVTELPPLPQRLADAHKGDFGHILIVAGSRGMSGAATLAGRGALHAGAGLVTVATAVGVSHIVAASHPSFMTWRLDEDADGRISESGATALLETVSGYAAVGVGPGLGQSEGVRSMIRRLVATEMPMVFDADALNAIAETPVGVAKRSSATVLTPHPGEMARLTGLTTGEIQQDRMTVASNFATQHKVVLLLKGTNTVITDGVRMAINTTGNHGMATGGSGDVLTGIITALIGQGMPAFEAAQLGAHVHGLAGDIAAEEFSARYMTSVEIADCLSAAWKRL